MCSVVEFIAECIAQEVDLSDSEQSTDPPVSQLPKLSDFIKRNPFYRNPYKNNEASISILGHKSQDKPDLENEETRDGKSKSQVAENNLTLQLSESDLSQVSPVEEDFMLQLSEDDELNNNKIEAHSKEQNDSNILLDQHSVLGTKHVLADIPNEEQKMIMCSDTCIVSKELQTSSNEAFEHVKQETPIKRSEDAKKRPSPDTPVKFFKIFKTIFKEQDDTGLKVNVHEQGPSKKDSHSVNPKPSERKRTSKCAQEQRKEIPSKKTVEAESPSRNIHFCSTCRTQVESLTALKQHTRMHAEGKMVNQCSICDRTFVTRSVLKRHLLTHSSDRRFSCSICSKKFIRRDYLSRHHRISHGLSK